MPETKLKSLHLGKSIADLKDKYNVTETIKGKQAKLLCRSAQKIYNRAEELRLQGDEELGYINFMKYLAIVTTIQHSEDYKKDREYYNELLGKENVKGALNKAEKLSLSLEQRYKQMKEQEKFEAEQLALEERDAEEQLKRKQLTADKTAESTHLVNGLSDSSDVRISISSKQLYDLLTEKKNNVLILDSRKASCYAKSHLNIGNCINVPEDIVKAGITAAALEKLLPPDSKAAWNKRRDADYIVLIDWSTTEKTHQPATNLHILKSILIRWDPGVVHKNPPVILEGGYEDWLLTYPQYTTNPKVNPPPQNTDSELDDLLDDVTYPNLIDDLVLQPSVNRALKPQSGSGTGLPLSNMNSGRVSNPIGGVSLKVAATTSNRLNNVEIPGVDRSSKAYAMQTYEERSNIAKELLRSKQKMAELEDETKLNFNKEWEIKRLNKEMEAEEERVQYLQSREEELLQNIHELEEKQRDQEAEKQSLKEEINKYKKQDAARREEKARKLKEEAEAKEEEKKRQEAKEREERKSADERQKIKEAEKAKKMEEEKRREREKGIPENEKGPQYDRSKKPPKPSEKPEIKAARQRDFSAVYGNKGRGLTGLKNLGNSCYMNSIIQCINNTTPLAFYFCEDKYRKNVNHYNNSTRGEVAEEVAVLIKALWSGQYRSVACRDLKSVVGQHRKQFQGYEQQDSHEFLTILMDWLHEDLNKAPGESPSKESSIDNDTPADIAWKKFQGSNHSLIRSLFYGQQKSTVRCCECGKESVTYEAFSDLSLPLPSSSNKCTVKDCIQLYLNGERISGWNCPSCKDKRDAIKKFDIWRLPPILVIHLNRFYHDGWWRKRQTYVDFPFTLNMREFTPLPDQRYVSYDLYGISNHYGTMEGGHYTAYCKNSVYGKWYKFDDHEVGEIPSSDVRSGAAYILFYASVEYKLTGS
ncbi:hypothetical protein C0J52_17324 [Blattella germanica]|nr:hypothetical protein C0J52_17324 [Blattella germanica]